jgi:hypothetical protein
MTGPDAENLQILREFQMTGPSAEYLQILREFPMTGPGAENFKYRQSSGGNHDR